ncbi:hypothetical protein Dsin_009495 [Dipteronia sinensis]|uniref:CCHC-type domain-containing protein n=1 Tax=Dipteronia sinensis TaxID=43782 RepID=A0AAE0ARD8_9ROSI|nr:hypothetical protein Dsin_009495 [Dipteronia sinensis]
MVVVKVEPSSKRTNPINIGEEEETTLGRSELENRVMGYWDLLGNMIGDVQEIDVSPTYECVGKYIRVRVMVNVSKPLHQILRVDVMKDGIESTILLRYEKLLDHCYRCGRLEHVVRECTNATMMDGLEDYSVQFGP